MNGIFISYASEDREKAEALAHALEQKGWPVWWDRQIPFGKSFDEVIEENLARAGCVLVLWTKVSVESRWVRSEASEAAAREVLIPVLFEPEVKIPLEFKLLQAVNLCDWHPDAKHRAFDALVAQIGQMLTAATSDAPTAAAGTQQPQASAGDETALRGQTSRREQAVWGRRQGATRARLQYLIVYIFAPTILLVIAGLVSTSWRVPTRMQLDIVVDRLGFTLAGEEAIDLPERALNFRSLSVENFDRAVFVPTELAVGFARGGDKVRFQTVNPGGAKPARIVLNGSETRPLVRIDAATEGASSAGRVEAISVKPGTKITVETSAGDAPGFDVRVEGQALQTNVLSAGALLISASNATTSGLPPVAPGADPSLLRVRLSEGDPYVQIQGARGFFVLSAMLAERDPVLLVGRARIQAVELLKQSADGSVQSALIAGGTISYPGYRQAAPIALNAGDFVGLRSLQDASIAYLRLRADSAALDLRLEGVSGQAERSVGGIRQDLTLTALDVVLHQARWVLLIAVLAWALLIALGVYRIYTSAHGAL